jgi:hypothetical protein
MPISCAFRQTRSVPGFLKQTHFSLTLRDLSHERESSEQFVWYGETETQLRRGAIMPSIEPIGVKMK